MEELSTDVLLSIEDINTEEAIPIQLNTEAKIKIANAIINSIFELGILEFKLICILASQKFDDDEKVYRVSANVLGELMNLSQKNRYTQLHCICCKLLKSGVQVFVRKNKNKIAWLGTPWFNFIFYDEGVIYFSFHPLIRPYITMLKSAYVTSSRDLFIAFRSIYSLRLYLILRMWFNMGHKTKTLTIENLKMLFCNSIKYNSVTDFIRFCVLPAIAEIEKLSSLRVKVIPIKTKAKITKITFVITEVVDTVAVIDDKSDEKERLARELMERCRCSERTIKKHLAEHSPERIIRWAEYTLSRDGIRNRAAYLTELLKKDYEDSEPAVTEPPKLAETPVPVPEQIEPSKEENGEKAECSQLLTEIQSLTAEEQEKIYLMVLDYCSQTKNKILGRVFRLNGVAGCVTNESVSGSYAQILREIRGISNDETSQR